VIGPWSIAEEIRLQIKIGKDNSFYLILEAQADVAFRAAQVFRDSCADFSRVAEHAQKANEIEHEGDELTHRLQNQVATTFITPLDKEDLRELSQTLDDITDAIEAVIARTKLYRLEKARRDLVPFADQMVKAADLVVSAIKEMKDGFHTETLQDKLTAIHTVENASDQLYRQALEDLFFEPGIDALTVMKWKEIYDRTEIAMDNCEDIAKILGTIIVKYA
jgi:uncharacterized protein